MYACTMCGLGKLELDSNPEFEFRSRRHQEDEPYIEGISDWCPKCDALRFFFKSNDSKKPAESVEEQPSHNVMSDMLDVTTKGWHNGWGSGSKSKIDSPKMNTLRNWKTQHDLRQEARKVIREELLAGLPAKMLRGSFWDHSRSHSEDRDKRHHRHHHHASEHRSRSAVNEPHYRKHRGEHSSHSSRRNYKKSNEESEQRNGHLDHDYGQEDIDDPRAPIPFKCKRKIDKLYELDMLNPWQEEVQRRTAQLRANQTKKEEKAARRELHQSLPKTLDYEKKPIFNVATGAVKRLTVEEVARDIKKIEEEELDDQLLNKLYEKKHLVGEWELIRRRVEDECERVKAELAELKNLRDMEIKTDLDRQRGGAQFVTYSEPVDAHSTTDKEKTIGDALDEKLELMLYTLQENAQSEGAQHYEPEKEKSLRIEPTAPPKDSELSSELTEIPSVTPVVESPAEIDVKIEESLKQSEARPLKPKRLLSKLHMLVSTVQRARFRGFPEDPQKLLQSLTTADLMKHRDPPPAQFSTLPCSPNELISLLSIKREVLQPHMTRPLKVCRSPIFCPDADCRRMFFISDFNDHLTHEHPALPMERISPCKAKTFFLDTRVTMLNKAKCNMVYFVKDKFFDKNTEKYPDLLPVLVMSARLQSTEFFRSKDSEPLSCCTGSAPDQEIFLLWLTSIRPDDIKIVGTISVWPTRSRPIIEYLMVQTNEVYNIRSVQKLKAIYNSNRVMAVPGNIVNRMTNNGEYLLAVQVLIH
ncbi:uncharacterized protein LOC111601670 [Drosophila hydei]|uniref:Uncharacterized protein LOC111601670 n=1 Tax=Drosophila hydei TaxID=7224 RepID=A0A6J1M6V8_DROHY|nr:uncharacterized protein LOC111601670 [Drosophila hydei]